MLRPLVVILLLFNFSQCQRSFSFSIDSVLLNTTNGLIRGNVFELPDGSKGYSFLGVRYAMPPIGDRRFRPPQQSSYWSTVYNATQFGPSCYQPDMFDVWIISDEPDSFPLYSGGPASTLDLTDYFKDDFDSDIWENISQMKESPGRRRRTTQPVNKDSGQERAEGETGQLDSQRPKDRKEVRHKPWIFGGGDWTYPNLHSDSSNDFGTSIANEQMSGMDEEMNIDGVRHGKRQHPRHKKGVLRTKKRRRRREATGDTSEQYLVQSYLHDVSEDCLSINIYTPILNAEVTHEVPGTEGKILKRHMKKQEWLRNKQEEELFQRYKQKHKTRINYKSTRKSSSTLAADELQLGDSHEERFLRFSRRDSSHWTANEDVHDDQEAINVDKSTKLPVIVFVHGGSYFGNAGRLYPGEKLASTGVIVVTINYRLGPFGFLSTGDGAARGNWGLLDQRLALVWLQQHITSFGGDPNKVLLAGNSAGAASVLLQLLSPRSKGLFSRVAPMSGSSLGPWAIQKNPLKFARLLADTFNCSASTSPSTDSSSVASNLELVECLRGIHAQDIMRNVTDLLADGLWVSYAAVVDGPWGDDAFLPQHPYELLSTLDTQIPVLYSTTTDEVSIWYRDRPDTAKLFQIESHIGWIMTTLYSNLHPLNMAAVIHAVRGEYLYNLGYHPTSVADSSLQVDDTHSAVLMTDEHEYPSYYPNTTAPVSTIAALISDLGLLIPGMEEASYLCNITNVYMAQFSFVSPDDVKMKGKKWIGAYHEHELQYLFGLPYWNLKNTLKDPQNRAFSHKVMSIYRHFADTGVPGGLNSSEQWPVYRRPGDTVMSVGQTTTMLHNYHLERMAFWKKFIPLLTKWQMKTRSFRTSSSGGGSIHSGSSTRAGAVLGALQLHWPPLLPLLAAVLLNTPASHIVFR